MEDYSKSAYRAHSGIENSRKKELYLLMPTVLQQIKNYFNLDKGILIDVTIKNSKQLDKCKIILGNLILSEFTEEKIDLNNLIFCKVVICSQNSKVKEIVLPKLIKKIHQEAFINCINKDNYIP